VAGGSGGAACASGGGTTRLIGQAPVAQCCDQHEPGQAHSGQSSLARGQIGVFGPAAFGLDPAVDGGLLHVYQGKTDWRHSFEWILCRYIMTALIVSGCLVFDGVEAGQSIEKAAMEK